MFRFGIRIASTKITNERYSRRKLVKTENRQDKKEEKNISKAWWWNQSFWEKKIS